MSEHETIENSVGAEPSPADDPDDGFAALGLRTELLEALSALGYEEPTPIQNETIPLLLAGKDLLGQAATGTGKTAAFALPVLHRIGPNAAPIPTVLVLVPTRELAVQVSEAMFKYGRGTSASAWCRSTAGSPSAVSWGRWTGASTWWSPLRDERSTTSSGVRSSSTRSAR